MFSGHPYSLKPDRAEFLVPATGAIVSLWIWHRFGLPYASLAAMIFVLWLPGYWTSSHSAQHLIVAAFYAVGLLIVAAVRRRHRFTYLNDEYSIAEALLWLGIYLAINLQLSSVNLLGQLWGWTADSKAVLFQSNRNDHWGIFKQSLNEDTAEPIVTGSEDAYNPRISPDGAWVVYIVRPREAGVSAPVQLMRIPVSGGAPQSVMTAYVYDEHRCAKSPAKFCALAEQTSDRKQLVFTAFHPLKGRGRELSRFDIDPDPNAAYGWDLSPDGTRIAVFKHSDGRIYILSFSGQQPREISVRGWNSIQSVDWAADGKGLFVSSSTPQGADLLHMDLHGNAHLIWQQKGNTASSTQTGFGGPSIPWAVPSPDGRHLAIYGWSLSANIWMIENF
jgi:hypothetical protein